MSLALSKTLKTGSVVFDSLLIVTHIVGFCNCSMFCSALLCVHFSFCNYLNGEERAGRFALFVFKVSRDCCVALPRGTLGFLRFVIVVFPDHIHLLFWHRCICLTIQYLL